MTGGAVIGSGGDKIGKLFEEECEDVGRESMGGLETEELDDGGGDNANVGEVLWSVPGVMVLFSDFGREVAKGEGAKGEGLMAGMNEGVHAVSGFVTLGFGGWVRRVEVSAVGVARTGGVISFICDGGVEMV